MPTDNEFKNFQFDANKPADRQFTSDKSGDPEELARQTASSQARTAELIAFLNNSLETAGSRVCNYGDKPWTSPHPEKPGPGDGKTGI